MAETTAEEDRRQSIRQFRETVGNAVSFVRSREINQSFAAIGLEELVDDQIGRIEASASATRPGRLAQIDKIKQALDDQIDSIKAMSPDLFRRPDTSADANTPRESEE